MHLTLPNAHSHKQASSGTGSLCHELAYGFSHAKKFWRGAVQKRWKKRRGIVWGGRLALQVGV